MEKTISDQIGRKLVNKIAGEIDLDGLAAKMAPKVAAQIEKEVLAAIPSLGWADIIDETLSSRKLWAAIELYVSDTLQKQLKK